MLEKLSADEENSILFSKIWDACSQMNSPLQSMFGVKDRVDFFGEAYDDYTFKIPKNNSEDNDNQSNCGNQTYNINDILSDNELKINDSETKEGSEKNESIIDFPNFLMHVLQLHLRKDVPLNGDELIDEFRSRWSLFIVSFFTELFLIDILLKLLRMKMLKTSISGRF